MNRAVLTIATTEYESKFKVHAESVKQYLPEWDHIRIDPRNLSDSIKATTRSKEHYLENGILNFICAIRPDCVLDLFEKGYDRVLFLGADVVFYSKPNLLENQDYNVMISPHSLTPYPFDGKWPNERLIAQVGELNSDFVLWTNIPVVVDFLKWQSEVHKKWCIEDKKAIYLDETWLQMLPSYVPYTNIIQHPCYNVHHSNLHERNVILGEDNHWYIDWPNFRGRLVCKQFSGVDINQPDLISIHDNRYLNVERDDDVRLLIKEYCEKVKGYE